MDLWDSSLHCCQSLRKANLHVGPRFKSMKKLQIIARCERNDFSVLVAKKVIKCSLQRTYLVVPYLKQCSPNPRERVLPSSHHSLKKKKQSSHIDALVYVSSKGKTNKKCRRWFVKTSTVVLRSLRKTSLTLQKRDFSRFEQFYSF